MVHTLKRKGGSRRCDSTHEWWNDTRYMEWKWPLQNRGSDTETYRAVYQRIQSETVGAKCFWWAYKILEEVLRTEGTVAWLLSQRNTTSGVNRKRKILYTWNKDTITHVLRPASVNHQTKVPPPLCLTIKMRWPDENDFTEMDEETRSLFVRCANFTSKMRHDYIKSNLASRSVRLTVLILGHVLDTFLHQLIHIY